MSITSYFLRGFKKVLLHTYVVAVSWLLWQTVCFYFFYKFRFFTIFKLFCKLYFLTFSTILDFFDSLWLFWKILIVFLQFFDSLDKFQLSFYNCWLFWQSWANVIILSFWQFCHFFSISEIFDNDKTFFYKIMDFSSQFLTFVTITNFLIFFTFLTIITFRKILNFFTIFNIFWFPIFWLSPQFSLYVLYARSRNPKPRSQGGFGHLHVFAYLCL